MELNVQCMTVFEKLQAREENFCQGKDKFIDWNQAKKDIRKSTS